VIEALHVGVSAALLGVETRPSSTARTCSVISWCPDVSPRCQWSSTGHTIEPAHVATVQLCKVAQ